MATLSQSPIRRVAGFIAVVPPLMLRLALPMAKPLLLAAGLAMFRRPRALSKGMSEPRRS